MIPLRLLSLHNQTAGMQWSILLALSISCVLGLQALRLPAALLLGPMIAAILVAAMDGKIRLPARLFGPAQGVIGCMIAHAIPLSIIAEIVREWPLFLAGVLSVTLVAATLGWLLTRWQVLPGTTAIWGSSPGAAMAMTLMSEAFGADIRLVAFMQYLRVVCVAVCASFIARIWAGGSGAPPPAIVWFPPTAWLPFIETMALIGIGSVLAEHMRIPAGAMLLPLVLGVILQDSGWMVIELPPWLLALCYALLGWTIGLRFTRPILSHAARAFPRVLFSIFVLIAMCGFFAALLVFVAGIDPLTAYLATSPGGADSVAIIASSSEVNLPFVMAMQIARFLLVLFTGPSLARFIAKRSGVL
nr:AbrB family transcriptional regulator [Beijerinckia indica]